MADESELPSQAGRVFAWPPKKHVILHYLVGRVCIFCWLILDTFCHVLPSAGLTGSSTWNWSFGFPEGAHNRGLPSNPTTYTTSLSLNENQPLVWLVVSSIPHYRTVSTFNYLQFVLKTECFCFSLRIGCRNSQEGFFFPLSATQTSKQWT